MSDTPFELVSGKSGRDDYAQKYARNPDFQAEWLRRGAKEKANSVEVLLAHPNIQPHSILELGCGSGAVIGELQKRNLAKTYFGIDYSKDAIQLMANHYPEIKGMVGDVTQLEKPFDVNHFDILVCSHTIEHLEDPLTFLRGISKLSFDYLIIEVPLEDLFLGRFKSLFRNRKNNSAGHVQFYNRKSLQKLILQVPCEILEDRLYAPVLSQDTLRFAYGDRSLPGRIHKAMTERLFPLWTAPIWKRLYHAHYAVLCRK